jgi:hypothetical protein
MPGIGWSGILKVAEGTDIDTTTPPTVTIDDAGMATSAWAYSIQGKFNVYTNRSASADTAWPTAMAMETDNAAAEDSSSSSTEHMTIPIVRSDPAGNVTLIWRKRTGTRFDLYGRRFSGGAWGAATLLETSDSNSTSWPALAVGTNGTAAATWYYDGAYDVFANVYR